MKIIHVSDRHYGQPGAVQANARVNNAIVARPDIGECVIIDTGDDVDSPTPANYQTATAAQRQLADRCRRMFKVPGNHDFDIAGIADSPTAPALWGNHVEKLTGERPVYPSMHVIGGVAVILVDTNRSPPGPWDRITSQVTATGLVGASQMEAVARMVKMARGFGLPVVLAMHHCPSGGDPLLRLHDRHELGAALEAAGGVDLILTGHLHQKREWSHVFGARYLLSSPKTPDAQVFTEIWWNEELGRFEWQWVDV